MPEWFWIWNWLSTIHGSENALAVLWLFLTIIGAGCQIFFFAMNDVEINVRPAIALPLLVACLLLIPVEHLVAPVIAVGGAIYGLKKLLFHCFSVWSQDFNKLKDEKRVARFEQEKAQAEQRSISPARMQSGESDRGLSVVN